ncbi:MAG: sugar kinase [Dictyoglomi bacterium]|jgi:2-dehydro-3-deoxygluconokinase|nr:sugar kinase [Dictyoglomota bacterium]HHV81374.1 sugar kinase [bacterium]
MPEVIGLGEIMVVMDPLRNGPLSSVENFRKAVGGAEGNTCVGVSRLGCSSGWIGRLGNDEFGKFILSSLKGENVDTSCVKTVEGFTGVYFKERRGLGDTRAYYYRKGSAGSTVSPEDIDSSYLKSAKFFHTTGITLALSETSRSAVNCGIDLVKRLGIKVSFDVNLRLKLWSKEIAKEEIGKIIPKIDILFLTLDEASILFGMDKPEEIIKSLLSLGPQIVGVKLGREGSMVGNFDEGIYHIPAFRDFCSVDNVGAGDGFVAGFLVGQLKGLGLKDSAVLGSVAGAYATTTTGDIDGLPTWDEVEEFLGKRESIRR